MTRQEKAEVLELARQLCLEVAAEARKQAAASRKYGHNSPGFNQDLGACNGAQLCAEAIEEAKAEAGGARR